MSTAFTRSLARAAAGLAAVTVALGLAGCVAPSRPDAAPAPTVTVVTTTTVTPPTVTVTVTATPVADPSDAATEAEETSGGGDSTGGGGGSGPVGFADLPAEPAPEPEPASAYYENCDAVRAAGAAPLYAGEPGYRAGLDRDGDGIACEN